MPILTVLLPMGQRLDTGNQLHPLRPGIAVDLLQFFPAISAPHIPKVRLPLDFIGIFYVKQQRIVAQIHSQVNPSFQRPHCHHRVSGAIQHSPKPFKGNGSFRILHPVFLSFPRHYDSSSLKCSPDNPYPAAAGRQRRAVSGTSTPPRRCHPAGAGTCPPPASPGPGWSPLCRSESAPDP